LRGSRLRGGSVLHWEEDITQRRERQRWDGGQTRRGTNGPPQKAGPAWANERGARWGGDTLFARLEKSLPPPGA
jgi:hypothetical protein